MKPEVIMQLQKQIDKLRLVGRPSDDENDFSFGFNAWKAGTVTYLQTTLPKATYAISKIALMRLERVDFDNIGPEAYNVDGIKNEARTILQVLIDTEGQPKKSISSVISVGRKVEEPVWKFLHPKVVELAKKKFSDGHHADAVLTCLREANTIIKEYVKKSGGPNDDGAPLMTRAFSVNQPFIKLTDDITTDDGKNMQMGYMKIFEGMMIGIRNPKSHSNYNLDKSKAIHFLFMCSFLFTKLEEAKVISMA